MDFQYSIQSFDSNAPSCEFSIWKASRKLGNYVFRQIEAANPLRDFKSACKQFGIYYDITADNSGTAVGQDVYVMLKGSFITVFYDEKRQDIHDHLDKIELQKKELFIKWWYNQNGSSTFSQMPLSGATPADEFYPWMTQSIQEFSNEYLNSSANVLLLIGPPGTGKTSFIRGVCRYLKCETWVTYDPVVQNNEQFYVNFASYKNSGDDDDDDDVDYDMPEAFRAKARPSKGGRCLVVEDADEMLSKRTDGNKVMNRLLNLSDGLVTLPARKIIFSTNLPGISSIDEALLRPGRCFAAIRFREITNDEAGKAAKAAGVQLLSKKEKMTLSEALNGHKDNTSAIRKIGF